MQPASARHSTVQADQPLACCRVVVAVDDKALGGGRGKSEVLRVGVEIGACFPGGETYFAAVVPAQRRIRAPGPVAVAIAFRAVERGIAAVGDRARHAELAARYCGPHPFNHVRV